MPRRDYCSGCNRYRMTYYWEGKRLCRECFPLDELEWRVALIKRCNGSITLDGITAVVTGKKRKKAFVSARYGGAYIEIPWLEVYSTFNKGGNFHTGGE